MVIISRDKVLLDIRRASTGKSKQSKAKANNNESTTIIDDRLELLLNNCNIEMYFTENTSIAQTLSD